MRRAGPEAGQATVELALALPVAVLIGLVGVQAGLVAIDALLVHHAAREAARAAAVDPSAAVARRAAEGATSLDGGRLDVGLGGGSERGDDLRVTVRYSSPTEVPLVGRLVGDVEVGAEVMMRVE